ncbi:MAG: hypothetical protein ACYC8T_23475, partial [Myxococcaceae bacterium]
KSVQVTLELRGAGGEVRQATVGYNEPLSSGLASELLILQQAAFVPAGVRLVSGGASCTLAEGGSCALGEVRVELTAFHPSGHWGEVPLAIVRATPPSGAAEGFYLLAGAEHRLAGGAALRFERVETAPAVMLRSRSAPGNPWALASAVTLGLGLVLMGRRWFPVEALKRR